jgi:hypothetical protein
MAIWNLEMTWFPVIFPNTEVDCRLADFRKHRTWNSLLAFGKFTIFLQFFRDPLNILFLKEYQTSAIQIGSENVSEIPIGKSARSEFPKSPSSRVVLFFSFLSKHSAVISDSVFCQSHSQPMTLPLESTLRPLRDSLKFKTVFNYYCYRKDAKRGEGAAGGGTEEHSTRRRFQFLIHTHGI